MHLYIYINRSILPFSYFSMNYIFAVCNIGIVLFKVQTLIGLNDNISNSSSAARKSER